LIQGLAEGKKGTYIHVSGAANLIDFSFPFGVASSTIVGDSDDAALISSLANDRIHAAIEQKIVSEGERLGIKTAIVSPPQVHGKGEGSRNTDIRCIRMRLLSMGKLLLSMLEEMYGRRSMYRISRLLLSC
jgi:hypothetical protein